MSIIGLGLAARPRPTMQEYPTLNLNICFTIQDMIKKRRTICPYLSQNNSNCFELGTPEKANNFCSL